MVTLELLVVARGWRVWIKLFAQVSFRSPRLQTHYQQIENRQQYRRQREPAARTPKQNEPDRVLARVER